jgi:hypothetical protein
MDEAVNGVFSSYVETFSTLRQAKDINIGNIPAKDVFLTDEEGKFMDIWLQIKAPLVKEQLTDLQEFVSTLAYNLKGNSYKDIFENTNALGLYNIVKKKEGNALNSFTTTTLEGVTAKDNIGYFGLSIIAQTLLFLSRITRRCIYKYRIIELQENGVLSPKLPQEQAEVQKELLAKKLNDVIEYCINMITAAREVDSKVGKDMQNYVPPVVLAQPVVTQEEAKLKITNMLDSINGANSLSNNILSLITKFVDVKNSDILKKALTNEDVSGQLKDVKKDLDLSLKPLLEVLYAVNSSTIIGKLWTDNNHKYPGVVDPYPDVSGLEGDGLKTFKENYTNLLEIAKNSNYISNHLSSDSNTLYEDTKKFSDPKFLKVIAAIQKDLSVNSKVYLNMLQMFELLSGTVRVIVRLKNNDNEPASANMTSYKVSLEKTTDGKGRNVYFNKVQHIYDTFYSTTQSEIPYKNNTITFGPFYRLIDTEKVDQIIDEALDYKKLSQLLLNKQKNVVLYSYGYSGSGKTFTFFGRLNEKDYSEGVVWKLMEKLTQDGATVKLVKRIKLYGILDAKDKDAIQFKDTIKWFDGESTVSTTKDYWNGTNSIVTRGGTISSSNSNLHRRIAQLGELVNDDVKIDSVDNIPNKFSFIKTTSNNPESSRGFYILKFEIKKGDNTSYLGVVDMAGNEDPYDIATSMCPTLPFNNMKELIEDSVTAALYDYVFQTISETLQVIVTCLVASLSSMQKKKWILSGLKLYAKKTTTDKTYIENEKLMYCLKWIRDNYIKVSSDDMKNNVNNVKNAMRANKNFGSIEFPFKGDFKDDDAKSRITTVLGFLPYTHEFIKLLCKITQKSNQGESLLYEWRIFAHQLFNITINEETGEVTSNEEKPKTNEIVIRVPAETDTKQPKGMTNKLKSYYPTTLNNSKYFSTGSKSGDDLEQSLKKGDTNWSSIYKEVTTAKNVAISLPITQGLIRRILDDKLTTLKKSITNSPWKNNSQAKQEAYGSNASLSLIKELTVLSKSDTDYKSILDVKAIEYVQNQLTELSDTITTLDFKVPLADPTTNDTEDEIYQVLIKTTTSVRAAVEKSLCNKLYFLSTKNVKDNMQFYYPYDTIAQIIKEGYYINKANAELINFFEKKREFNVDDVYFVRPKASQGGARKRSIKGTKTNLTKYGGTFNSCNGEKCDSCVSVPFENPDKHVNPETYKFCGNFDFKSYQKFSSKFNLASSGKKEDNNYYDTNLVPIIVKEFCTNDKGIVNMLGTKDIMFCCIRNDRDVSKALGAIDTLALVQKLKST